MRQFRAFSIVCLTLIGVGCESGQTASGSGQTPSEFYVSVEHQWCKGLSVDEMMSKYYYDDMATRRFVNRFSKTFSSPTNELERYCRTYDVEENLHETRTQKVANGRFAVLGMTMDGSFKRLPNQWILENDGGYLIQFKK